MIRFVCLLLACCYFSSCKKSNSQTSNDQGQYTIAYNNCHAKTVINTKAKICFAEIIEDSRCPPNANCIWEGVAIAKFSLTVNSIEYPLTLATKKFPGRPSTDTTVAGYQLELAAITPYPGSSTEPVQAVLRISY